MIFQLKLLSFVYESVNKLSPTFFPTFFELAGHVHQYGTHQVENNDIFLTPKNILQYAIGQYDTVVQRLGIKSPQV